MAWCSPATTMWWSPTAKRCSIGPCRNDGASSRTGAPSSSRDHRVGEAKRSTPRVAKQPARSVWVASKKLITTVSAAASVAKLDDSLDRANETIGGLKETETTEVAVKPTGPSPASAVTTATPPAWHRKIER